VAVRVIFLGFPPTTPKQQTNLHTTAKGTTLSTGTLKPEPAYVFNTPAKIYNSQSATV